MSKDVSTSSKRKHPAPHHGTQRTLQMRSHEQIDKCCTVPNSLRYLVESSSRSTFVTVNKAGSMGYWSHSVKRVRFGRRPAISTRAVPRPRDCLQVSKQFRVFLRGLLVHLHLLHTSVGVHTADWDKNKHACFRMLVSEGAYSHPPFRPTGTTGSWCMFGDSEHTDQPHDGTHAGLWSSIALFLRHPCWAKPHNAGLRLHDGRL